MAGEWPTVPLSDLTEPDTPVTYGVVKPGPEDPEGVLFIRGGDIADGRVLTEQLRTITRDVSQQYRRTQLRGGEIVVSLVGNPGQVAIVPYSLKGANIARQAGLVRLRDDVDTRFVKYFLSSRSGQEALGAHSLGSVQQVINLRDLKTVRVPVPPLPEQRAIAHILGTLDDKIELNRRMSETLEAMARALFKSWFVDFDPVRAKAEGRARQDGAHSGQPRKPLDVASDLPWPGAEAGAGAEGDPGLPKHLADLFPARLVDSELGEIPEGWEVGCVESLCESITSGGTPARMNRLFWEGGSIPWFKTGELLDGPLVESEEHITQAALDGSSCKLWPAGTILFALYASPTVGRLGVLTRPGTSNQAAAGLIAKSTIGVPFLRRLLLDARVKLQTIAVGAAQQNINQAVLKAHRAVIPTEKAASAYSRLVAAADERQVALSLEANALTTLRDTLLPKLISGELRVEDAERVIAGVEA